MHLSFFKQRTREGESADAALFVDPDSRKFTEKAENAVVIRFATWRLGPYAYEPSGISEEIQFWERDHGNFLDG